MLPEPTVLTQRLPPRQALALAARHNVSCRPKLCLLPPNAVTLDTLRSGSCRPDATTLDALRTGSCCHGATTPAPIGGCPANVCCQGPHSFDAPLQPTRTRILRFTHVCSRLMMHLGGHLRLPLGNSTEDASTCLESDPAPGNTLFLQLPVVHGAWHPRTLQTVPR